MIGSIETVGRTGSRNDRHWTLTIAAIEHLQEVGLLALRRHTCRRTAPLYIDDDQRKLVDDGKVHRLTLQADTRSGCRSGSQCTCESSADG